MDYIGIDLGTSAVKIVLMDENGVIKSTVSGEYPIRFPKSGWAEQDPEDWFAKVTEGLREVLKEVKGSDVRGIGVAGQMHGLVVLDKEDRVLRPAILWNDGRTQEETDVLNEEIGKKRLTEYTGNIAFAGFTAPKLMWMKKHEPDLFEKIDKIMLPKDYINYRLTGVHCTDYSDASGMLLLDVKKKAWSKEMIEICGIKERMLPKLFESYEKVGQLTKEIAEMTGLSEEVIVVGGAGDNAGAAVGTGTVGNGTCNISLGTSGTIFIAGSVFKVDEKNSLHAFAHADGGFHLMGCMLSAASCNKWWVEDILKSKDFEEEQKEILEEDLGSGSLYYLPYLMGERAPHNDSYARSAFIGMSMDTKRKDMTRAVLEGVAFGIRDSFEAAKEMGISIEKSTICGGGAKSPLWRKIIANVLNIDLYTGEGERGPGYGAAILAAVGSGRYPSVKEASNAILKIRLSEKPDPKISRRYEEKYRTFRKLYPALKDLFKEL